jgi:hypothetical protein
MIAGRITSHDTSMPSIPANSVMEIDEATRQERHRLAVAYNPSNDKPFCSPA